MKSKLLALALSTASLSALAVPTLPGGPLFIKFSGAEQIATVGSTGTAYGDSSEINWGVVVVDTINPGIVTSLNTIATTGSPVFTNSVTSGQITGMFYGVHALPPGTGGNPFPATSGFLDFYYRDATLIAANGAADLPTSGPGVRTGLNTAGDFTDGVLLAHLAFTSGINTTSASVFINGSLVPSSGSGFAGLATSYADVITGLGGLWETKLDTNFFVTPFGTPDFRFRNIYEENTTWNGDLTGCAPGATSGNCILGANVTDPATTSALPEPSSVALLGLGLFAVGALRRRKQA